MLFSWLRNRRRKKILAEPFPADWIDFLEQNVPHYQALDADEQAPPLALDLAPAGAERVDGPQVPADPISSVCCRSVR